MEPKTIWWQNKVLIGNSSKHFKRRPKIRILVSFKGLWNSRAPRFLQRQVARILDWTIKPWSLIEPLFTKTLKLKFSWVRLRINVWLTKPGIQKRFQQVSLLCVILKDDRYTRTNCRKEIFIQSQGIIFYIFLCFKFVTTNRSMLILKHTDMGGGGGRKLPFKMDRLLSLS